MNTLQRLLPIYLVIFFGYIGYSLIITIFTPMLLYTQGEVLPPETPKEMRLIALGLVIFLYPFGQFLSSPILGALSDRIGRRPVLLFSLVVSTFIYSMIGIGVWRNNFWIIAVSLLIAGLSEGNITIAQSTIADISSKKERSRFFGYITFSASLSYIVGPLFAGKLADSEAILPLSFATPFFVISLLLFAILCWLYVGFKESLSAHKRVKISYFEAFTNLKNLFFMRHVRFFFLVNFLLYLSIFGFFQSFPTYLVTQYGIDVWHLALFIAWTSIPFLLVNLWLPGRLERHFSLTYVAIFASIWTGIFLVVLIIPHQMWALWISLFLVGLGAAMSLPTLPALLSSSVEEYEQGRVMGINQSLQFFAEAFSGLAMGFLSAIFVKLSLIIFGVLSLIGAILLLSKKQFPLR